MSSYIPGLPDISYWDASPRFRELCERKLGAGYIRALPELPEMGRRSAFELAPVASSRTPANEKAPGLRPEARGLAMVSVMRMPVMAVMRHLPCALDTVADGRADDDARRSEKRAGGGADGGAAGTALRFRPVICKSTLGRNQQRARKQRCDD